MATTVKVAQSHFARLRGLLFSQPLARGQGLYLLPCSSIHMIGMGYPIDAIFVDRNGVVVGLVKNLTPWKVSKIYWRAHGCLELPVGTIDATGTACGDILAFE